MVKRQLGVGGGTQNADSKDDAVVLGQSPDSLYKLHLNKLPRPGGPSASNCSLNSDQLVCSLRMESQGGLSFRKLAPLRPRGSATDVSVELHIPGSVASHRHLDVMAHCSQ